MIDCNQYFLDAYADIQDSELQPWMQQLPDNIENCFSQYTHGELEKWHHLLTQLIEIENNNVELSESVSVGDSGSLSEQQRQQLTKQLAAIDGDGKSFPFVKKTFPLSAPHNVE